MITDLKPYPAYKDSGVEWLGEVPEGWEVRRAKHILRTSSSRSTDGREPLLSVSKYTGVTLRLQSDDEPEASLVDYRRVSADQLVVNIMLAWNGSLGVASMDGLVSPAYAVFSFRQGLPQYFHHLLRTSLATSRMKASSRGVVESRLRLYPEDLFRIELPVPPSPEQAAIVRFLSYFDSRIQRFIAAQERLVEVLEEEKQAIINRVVTRGLDADAPLKHSGIDWLGDVPESWKVMKLKFLGRIGARLVDPRQPEFIDQVLIAPNHVQSATGRLLWQESAREQGAESGKYIVRKGEVVYSKIRPALRKAIIAPVDGLCSADMYPIAPRQSLVDPRYLLMTMLSGPFTRYVIDCSLRVAMPKVNREALGDAWIAFPGLPEQREVVEFLDRESTGPNETIARADLQMALLREYRTRLIADVVTGKLDVRQVVANLPDDPEADDNALDERLAEVAAG